MSLVSSLTVTHIIDPVLFLQEAQGDGFSVTSLSSFAKREIAARIMAIFTSAVALIDLARHTATALYKTAYLGVEGVVQHTILRFFITLPQRKWDADDIEDHWEQVKMFTEIALIGSIAGLIWPALFSHFPHTEGFTPPEEELFISSRVATMLSQIQAEKKPSTSNLIQFWQQSALLEKRVLTIKLAEDHPSYQSIREALLPYAFQKIDLSSSSFVRLFQRQSTVTWLSQKAIADHLGQGEHSAFTQAFYYHATSEKKLLEILSTKMVPLTSHTKPPSCFVTTKIEPLFGPCILAFRKSIERLFPLSCGFQHQKDYWAGFGSALPVTVQTLAYIIFNTESDAEIERLEKTASKLAKRKIHVFKYSQAFEKAKKMKELGLGIPLEWTRMAEREGEALYKKLQQEALSILSK